VLQVLHVIERLSLGGAGRALVSTASWQAGRAGHRIVSLQAPDPAAAGAAAAHGLALVPADRLAEAVGDADILHIHFWNSPDLYAALGAALPPARIALTCHVNGLTVPQVLTEEIVAFADLVLATSPMTLEAGEANLRRKAVLAPSGADFGRLAGFRLTPHAGFNIGYVGALDFAKLHPDYIALHAALPIAEARVLIHGDGAAAPTLRRQIAASPAPDRFTLHGYARDIVPALAGLNAFGYPLCEDNHSTSDLVLQEAMYAGLPSVVFPHGGAARLVADGETGFVARTATEYAERLVQLYEHPNERARMGRAAADHARSHLGLHNLAPLIDQAYAHLMVGPKRARAPIAAARGADAFIHSLGPSASAFSTSRSGSRAEAEAADAAIKVARPGLASATGGGVLHYRRAYPDDPWLRLWAGLVLLGEGRPALAAAEFTGAARQGVAGGRAAAYLAQSLDAARSGR
jgi:glycosyltransferase involved in cell wall biosynthesis